MHERGVEPEGFVNFDPAGRWEYIEYSQIPSWLKDQLGVEVDSGRGEER